MSHSKVWTRDIDQLESLAKTEVRNVGEDMARSADLVQTLTVDSVAFGELDVSRHVAEVYNNAVRARFEQALRDSSKRVGQVVVAVAAVAGHYRMLDEHYGR